MSTSSIAAAPVRFGLIARLGVAGAVLAVETLLASYLIQATPRDDLTGAAELVRYIQHWLFRFVIAYAVSLAMLVYMRGGDFRAALSSADHAPVRARWGVAHLLLLLPFAYLSAALYASGSTPQFAALALAWHACALAAALALFAALAPLRVWMDAFRITKGLPLFAVLTAAAAVIAIRGSQMLWAPAAKLTFRVVVGLLRPFIPTLRSDPAALTLYTSRFAVQVAEVCSGLEGIGLILAFCAVWLWLFRREYYFPRALLVVPIGVLVMFLLNAIRIAALVMIGDAGYERIATVGFHSQAGWIAFNLAAFGLAILAHNSPWMSRVAAAAREPMQVPDPARAPAGVANPTAAYLVPLLIILAAGMIAHLLSAGFELLYPLRLLAALGALWIYRRAYAGVDFRFSWRGPAVGIAVFALWAGFAALVTVPATEPRMLAAMPGLPRGVWIVCRTAAAVFTVPIAEELAYRGFLLRRLVSPHFETVSYSSVRWPALALSALAFGITHGGLWFAGIAAGLAYGALAIRTNKLGEAIAAHGTTNALLAGYVLLFDQWQLW